MPEYEKDTLIEVAAFWQQESKAGRKYWKCNKPKYDSLEKLVDMANRGELSFIMFPVDNRVENGPVVRLYVPYREAASTYTPGEGGYKKEEPEDEFNF